MKPGVVYTTFHNPETGANVVTTEYSDWATSCPEYKVTAVQIAPASHRIAPAGRRSLLSARNSRVELPNRPLCSQGYRTLVQTFPLIIDDDLVHLALSEFELAPVNHGLCKARQPIQIRPVLRLP